MNFEGKERWNKGKKGVLILIGEASWFKIVEISFPLCLFVALIKEVCPNTNYIRHINRGNYAYANFSLVLDLKMILPRCCWKHWVWFHFFFLLKTKSTWEDERHLLLRCTVIEQQVCNLASSLKADVNVPASS